MLTDADDGGGGAVVVGDGTVVVGAAVVVVVVGGGVVVVGGSVVVVVGVGGEVVTVVEKVVVVELVVASPVVSVVEVSFVVSGSAVSVVAPSDAESAPRADAMAGWVEEVLVSSSTSPEVQANRTNAKTPTRAADLPIRFLLPSSSPFSIGVPLDKIKPSPFLTERHAIGLLYLARQATTSMVLSMDERHRHAHRIRKVSSRYPRRGTERYDGDRASAMTDTDDDVMAATVADWKKAQGLKVTDWPAVDEPYPRT